MSQTIRERVLARRDLDALRAARDITGLAAAFNDSAPSVPQQRFVTARAIMSGCAQGVAILTALQNASSNPAVGWALKFLGQEAGLDIGDPFAQGMVDQLVQVTVLTADQGAQLKALALKPLLVTQEQIAAELYNPDGSEK